MTSADLYRRKAVEFATLAQTEADPNLQAEYATMAASYFRLAQMAERNSETDVVYETPPLADSSGQQSF